MVCFDLCVYDIIGSLYSLLTKWQDIFVSKTRRFTSIVELSLVTQWIEA